MYNFIVLGYVPGTNLQLTFQAWLIIYGLAAVAFALYKLSQLHRELSLNVFTRQPLHATQLHRRG